MTAVGISGHQDLPVEASTFMRASLAELVPEGDALVGYSSLAEGADQIFAEFVLAQGGQLHVVLPCADYESTFKAGFSLAKYQVLLARAVEVQSVGFPHPSEEAFFAAGRAIVDACDLLIAVWDGQPARGLGGTADVVAYAERRGRRVEVVWPPGVAR